MIRRTFLVALLTLICLPAARASADVPVHVRVIQGSRKGPAHVDPKLDNMKRQLSSLAYLRWEQRSEQVVQLAQGKTEFVILPGGEHVGLTLQEQRGQTVTVEVALASRNTQSRLTVEKGQRIVHQVTGERSGSAYFLTVLAWP